jgi:hypothetical protein
MSQPLPASTIKSAWSDSAKLEFEAEKENFTYERIASHHIENTGMLTK